MYDYLIVGSGLFGSVFAHEATARGKKVLVIERRNHTGGNIYCENKDGINIHKYGAHIFHTSVEAVWQYVNRFVTFNNYVNSPVANYQGKLYNLPFNMNTFSELWGVVTPAQAAAKIAAQRTAIKGEPKNLEEQAISLVGTDIYTKLIKGYTEKQWGRSCTELPAFIIKRLPVRYTFDNNYFNDPHQGIPVGGYNKLIEKLLTGVEVRLGIDFNKHRDEYAKIARKIIYTGPIDAYFNYQLGQLEYRGLRFETERLAEQNHQGVAVMNYTERAVPYTRIIEHKHFEFGQQPVTYVTKEYPAAWHPGEEAYYPVNNEQNQALYAKYAELAQKEGNVIFGGRLAEYKYYDMDKVIESALGLAERELMCRMPGYHKALIIFMDILGSQSKEDFKLLYDVNKTFHGQLLENEKNDNSKRVYERKIYTFSDCAYIIYDFKDKTPAEKRDLGMLFEVALCNCEPLLLNFLSKKIIFRGGVTYGDIYYEKDKNLLFGPGVNLAYQMESGVAEYPRIVVENEVAKILIDNYNKIVEQMKNPQKEADKLKFQKFGNIKEEQGCIVKKDFDGVYMIDYLQTVKNNTDWTLFTGENNKEFIKNLRIFCNEQIEKNKKNLHVLKKYTWLLNYINRNKL